MSLDYSSLCQLSEQRFLTQNLPLLPHRTKILSYVLSNQSLILKADTGLGKTTQLPQYLFFHPYFQDSKIFCTQPRKLAAASAALRVSEEMASDSLVSSCLSSNDFSNIQNSSITYFSESAFLSYLLLEIYNEIPLSSCKALIIDEAHERNVETDVILALIKKYVLIKRPDFRLIITSATLQTESMSKYLSCPVLECKGSAYEVEELFVRRYDSYFFELVNTVLRVIQGKLTGNQRETILVFLAGFDEINSARNLIKAKIASDDFEVVILCGRLDFQEQQNVIFGQEKRIRVVLSTNIAESSLTVPGVTCVVDCGREKVATGAQWKDFRVKFITKMSAKQRMGRAGRTGPGVCHRIYTEDEYRDMEEFRVPAIVRSNIGLLVLRFLKYGIFEVQALPLIDPPDAIALKETHHELETLGMIEISNIGTPLLTDIGNFALELEIIPMLSRFIYFAYTTYECGDEATMLSSLLICVDFISPRSEYTEKSADSCTQYILSPSLIKLGDIITALFTFRQYRSLLCESCEANEPTCTCSDLLRSWSQKFFISDKKLKSAFTHYKLLIQKISKIFTHPVFYFSEEEWALEKQLANLSLCDLGSSLFLRIFSLLLSHYEKFYESYFQDAVIKGMFQNLAQYRGEKVIDAGFLYVVTKEIVVPHPCSPIGKLLFAEPPKYVIFFEVSVTSNLFMKYISPVSLEKFTRISGDWLKSINFSEDIEPVAGLVFQNLGPAYMRELLGNSGIKLYDLESALKAKGAYGALILPDLMKNTVKLRIPMQYRKIGEEELRNILDAKQKEVMRKNIVYVKYSKGLILILTPGGLISDIVSSENSLVYRIFGMKSYGNYLDALSDIQNTFDFHYFDYVRKPMKCYGVVYFKSQKQAEEAKAKLMIKPLIGKAGPIFEMTPAHKPSPQPCLKVVTSLMPQLLGPILTNYGDHQYIKVFPYNNQARAFVRYKTQQGTDSCFSQLKHQVAQEFGAFLNIFKLQDGVLVPKELLACEAKEVQLYLDSLGLKEGVELHFSGKKVMRITGDLENLTSDTMTEVMDLVDFDTISATVEAFRCLESSNFGNDRKNVSWKEWQWRNRVCCSYLPYRSAIAIYGIPNNRQSASKSLQNILTGILRQLFTAEISYSSMKELRIIELFKKQHAEKLKVEVNINRRKGSFTITGIRDNVKTAIEELHSQDKFIQPDGSCGICLNVYNENSVVLSLCGHRFHGACLSLQIKNSISSAAVAGFPINCVTCGHPLVHNDWCKVLPYDDLQALYRGAIIQFLSENPNFSHCENPSCDYIYNISGVESMGTIRSCKGCKGNFCIICKKQVFSASHPLNCANKIPENENMQWIQTNTKPCPNCHVFIEKDRGCNHIKCPRCASHFCFLCGEILSQDYPVDHYRDTSKGCYLKYISE